jgi:hypothetical protein
MLRAGSNQPDQPIQIVSRIYLWEVEEDGRFQNRSEDETSVSLVYFKELFESRNLEMNGTDLNIFYLTFMGIGNDIT